MSTRTDWGYFDKDGKPLAVGDEHHKWECPRQEFAPTGHEHIFTGEWIDTGLQPVRCPMKEVAPKLERCERCGVEFRYP